MLEPTSKLKIVERRIDDLVILELTGEITLDDGDLVFRGKIHELLDKGCRKVVLNLAGLTKIDSAGVGMLAAKLKMARQAHSDVKLVNLTPAMSRLLGMMKILTHFEVFDDEEDAVRSFSQG